jgi:hypothetical protein
MLTIQQALDMGQNGIINPDQPEFKDDKSRLISLGDIVLSSDIIGFIDCMESWKDEVFRPYIASLKLGLSAVVLQSLLRLEHRPKVVLEATLEMRNWLEGDKVFCTEDFEKITSRMSKWVQKTSRFNTRDMSHAKRAIYLARRRAYCSAAWGLGFFNFFSERRPEFFRNAHGSLHEARESAGCSAVIWINKKDYTRDKARIAARRDEWKRQKADILEVFPPLILKQ